jgi:class 3 adenylate cyclase/GAF domain-containing protein
MGAELGSDYSERLLFSLSSLGEISDLVASDKSFEEVSEAGLRSTMGVVAASHGLLLFYDSDQKQLNLAVARGINPEPFGFSVNQEMLARLTDAQETISLTEDVLDIAPFSACKDQIRTMQSHLWVPLVVKGELQGLLCLGKKFLDQEYSIDDLNLLWTIGKHVAIGFYNQHLVGELRDTNFQLNRKVVELETVYDAGLALASSLQVETVFEEILLLAVGMVDARSGFLLVRDEESADPILVQDVGLSDVQRNQLGGNWLREQFDAIVESGESLRLPPEEIPTGLGIGYLLGVPVGKVGVLGVVDKESRTGIEAFSDSDARLLDLIGRQAGAALANARLYRNILEVKNYNQNILGSIGNGVISTDLAGRIRQVNPSVAAIFPGVEVPLGSSSIQFLQRCGCKAIASAVEEALSSGESGRVEAEFASTCNVTLDAQVTALRDENDEILGAVITLEDLTKEMRVRSMFKQYASDQVVDLLLNKDTEPRLGGEKREVTVLVVDIRGSVALVERIGSEQMMALINSCFGGLTDIVFDYNGTLEKFTGDGFQVFYGAPVTFPDDSERSVKTALSMREEMIRFNQESGEPLGLGFGIARGTVVAGNIGSDRRMEYTVIGRAVNLANRICSDALAGEIWADEQVYNDVAGGFEFGRSEKRQFKGFLELTDVYEVVRATDTSHSSGLTAQREAVL